MTKWQASSAESVNPRKWVINYSDPCLTAKEAVFQFFSKFPKETICNVRESERDTATGIWIHFASKHAEYLGVDKDTVFD